MTHRKYTHRWSFPEYRRMVRAQAWALGSDGCTGVPEFFQDGCLEHDIAYRTHRDPFGNALTKKEADKRFRWYIQDNSIFGRFSPMAWWRWWFLNRWVKKAWSHSGERAN